MFEPLPTLIRDERERQELSQLALANLAGVSRTTIVALESGEDNISLGVLVKVAAALKITELRIGDLGLAPASTDLRVLLLAREAIAAAEKVVGQAAASQRELAGLSASVSELLHRELEPPRIPDGGIARAAQRLASRPPGRSTARALRDLAESSDRVPPKTAERPHAAQRPKAAAKTAARRRAR